MRIKAINGVLHNFLGTYTSRYSDYDGYWLFGWLVNDVDELKIDLLSRDPDWVGSGPRVAAIRRALLTFHEQMEKAALDVPHPIAVVHDRASRVHGMAGLLEGSLAKQ